MKLIRGCRPISGKARRRYEAVASMREQGMTLQAIGARFGLSRQRVFQILKSLSPDKIGRSNDYFLRRTAYLLHILHLNQSGLSQREIAAKTGHHFAFINKLLAEAKQTVAAALETGSFTLEDR